MSVTAVVVAVAVVSVVAVVVALGAASLSVVDSPVSTVAFLAAIASSSSVMQDSRKEDEINPNSQKLHRCNSHSSRRSCSMSWSMRDRRNLRHRVGTALSGTTTWDRINLFHIFINRFSCDVTSSNSSMSYIGRDR